MKHFVHYLLTTTSLILVSACSQTGPKPFKIGKDACDFCKMTIMEKNSGMELITSKGKIFLFDDISCGLRYQKKNPGENQRLFVSERTKGAFISAETAIYLKSENLKTPMASNISAFSDLATAKKYQEKSTGKIMTWDEVKSSY